MARRSFLLQMMSLPFAGLSALGQTTTRKPLNIMMKSAWGSDDPTKARSVTEADLDQWAAKFGNPQIFVSLVEWADRVITE